ncbi:MAG: hypothetical protein KGI97_03835 [Alphaproteobacteria bacterium]|nr:hypothetical protein [Alphaproteobacteria bacterium]
MKKLATIILALFVVHPALADAPAPLSPELKAFLARPDQENAYVGMMMRQWQISVPSCPSPQIKNIAVLVDHTPTFDKSGLPVSGQWRVIGYAEGCNESRIFNMYYGFSPDGKMTRIALLPGTTRADLTLQRDSLMYAMMGMAKLTPKGCKDIHFTDTKFIGYGKANPQAMSGREKRSWTEKWTIRTCGVTGVVSMRFVPDATGTTILTDASKTRQISP